MSSTMPWTVLNCGNIEFSSVQSDTARIMPNEPWESARVSVIAMSEHNRESSELRKYNHSYALFQTGS